MTQPTHLLPVFDSLSTAWDKIKGAKKTIWAAYGIFILLLIGIAILESLFKNSRLAFPVHIVAQAVNLLLQAGILYIGIKRAFDLPIHFEMTFRGFDFPVLWKVLVYYFLKSCIIMIPLLIAGFFTFFLGVDSIIVKILAGLVIIVFCILPIYLFYAMTLGIGFIVDKDLNPIEAIKSSFIATRSNILRLIAIQLLLAGIIIISIIPLGIGLIWTIPFSYVLYGVIYRNLLINLSV